MTELCYFNLYSALERHAELDESDRTALLRRMSGLRALQIWTRSTIISGAPCWKSIINFSRSLTQLLSWKSPCRPSWKRYHKNTSSRWRTSPNIP